MVAICCSCSCNKNKYVKGGDADTLYPEEEPVVFKAENLELPDELSPFLCVLDTLNASEDRLIHVEYFLYDITRDGEPELWIKCGSCEADSELWVYGSENGNVRKILSDYGGHTEFFIIDGGVGGMTSHTGTGYITSYEFQNGKISTKRAEFSLFNEEGEIRAIKKEEQRFIDNILEDEGEPLTFKLLL